MRRVVSVYLPTWPTDRLRARARSSKNRQGRPGSGSAPDADEPTDKPFVVASTGAQRVITAVDMAAHRLGLRRGIPLAQARAMVPDLMVADADPDGDERPAVTAAHVAQAVDRALLAAAALVGESWAAT